MNLNHYDLAAKSGFLSFEFLSHGQKGIIIKHIEIRKLVTADSSNVIYTLAFGDYNEVEDRIDDLVVSDNKDSEKILATVATALIAFTDNHPDALVFAQGSSASSMRYYIMGITKYLTEISQSFEIWGALSEKQWELFRRNRPYKALLAKRK